MRRRAYRTWKISFPSKALYFWFAHSACYTCLLSTNAGNGCFGRSRFQNSPPPPPDPLRGSRLPALGPLFTNFLDPPLLDVHVQPSSPENTPRPSFDVKTVSCNTSENLRFFVKREKHFLVANISTGGGGVTFWELKFPRGLFFSSNFLQGCKLQS